jgi:hypothetical protein
VQNGPAITVVAGPFCFGHLPAHNCRILLPVSAPHNNPAQLQHLGFYFIIKGFTSERALMPGWL